MTRPVTRHVSGLDAPGWQWEHFWLVVNFVSIVNNIAFIIPLLGADLLQTALDGSKPHAVPAGIGEVRRVLYRCLHVHVLCISAMTTSLVLDPIVGILCDALIRIYHLGLVASDCRLTPDTHQPLVLCTTQLSCPR